MLPVSQSPKKSYPAEIFYVILYFTSTYTSFIVILILAIYIYIYIYTARMSMAGIT